MLNYNEITAFPRTDLTPTHGFDFSVSHAKPMHFITKSPAKYRKHGSGSMKYPIPEFSIGFSGFYPLIRENPKKKEIGPKNTVKDTESGSLFYNPVFF